MARRSLRAAHWNEAKHPRDDRGRFSRKGGGKWFAKVAHQMQARFGDISMGAHPDHTPQGKLQTGKGSLIDTAALSKAAPRIQARSPLGPVEAPGGRVGRTPTGTFTHGPKSATSSHPANAVATLNPGDHARVQGIDQYGKPTTLNGHVQGVGKVKMGKRGSRAKQDMLAVQMAETPSGANGWRGTVYVKPDATAERTTPKREATASGAFVGDTGLDTSRVGRKAGGVTLQQAMRDASAGKSDETLRKVEADAQREAAARVGHVPASRLRALAQPRRTNTGEAANNAHGGNTDFAEQLHGEMGAGDALARETAPRTGRTAAGRVGGVRQTASTSDAAERLQSATTREEGQAALEGMSVAELKDVARKLNVRRDQANKQELKDRIVERTVGSRINAGVLRENVGTADVRTGRTAAGERTLRRNEFGFPQTEGPQRPPVGHEERLATRDGIPPTDGRPDITMLAASNSKNDYHRWSLSTSAGRDKTMAPDVARVSGGVLDNKAVSAVVMNPKDGTGEYRYRIVEEGTGNVLEEGSGHDAGEVFAKADRIFSSQRGGGIARTAGNEVHYAARSKQRPKDLSRGDFGTGPFYDFTVVQVDKNGNEREVVKTNSMDRAHQHAAAMNAKEEGATERAAAALQASRSTSMADIYNRHRDLTREQFDALPADQQQRVLNDLRKVRDSKEQVSHTIPSNRTTMGTTIRGTQNAPHVDAAQAKLRELTYTAPPPVDNSIEGQAARLKAGQLGSFYGTGLTKDRLQAISMAAGYGGFPNTWKLTKVHDYLRARVAAGDAYTNRTSLADALRAATSREQARAMLEAQEIDTGLSMAEMKRIAGEFGGTLRGDKRKHMADLAELTAGRRSDSEAIARTANGPSGRTEPRVAGGESGFVEPPPARGGIDTARVTHDTGGMTPEQQQLIENYQAARRAMRDGDRPHRTQNDLAVRKGPFNTMIAAARALREAGLDPKDYEIASTPQAAVEALDAAPDRETARRVLDKLSAIDLQRVWELVHPEKPRPGLRIDKSKGIKQILDAHEARKGGNLGKAEAGGTGARVANLEKARTVRREMRAEELTASREPKDNGAKIRAVQSGTIASAELYRKAAAGPSGQRTNLLIGRVRHTPDNPSGEFKITDANGNHTGWASRTVHDGESVYVFHSEDADGGQRHEGWSDSLAVGVDVLNNGHHQATGYGLDSTRTSGGTFQRYEGRNKSVAELDRDALNQEIGRLRERLATPGLTPGLRTRAEADLARLEAERQGGPGAEVDTARVTRDTGGMTATTDEIDKVIGRLDATMATRAAADLRGIRQRSLQADTSAADTAAEIRVVAKGSPTDIKQALNRLARKIESDGQAEPTAATARVDEREVAFLRGLSEPFLASTVSEARFKRLLDSGQIRPTGKTYRSEPLYEAVPAAGPIPKVTGYAKGRELEPGMLVNAADLLPMHESQGNTTGENPNPSGHADWVRVGMVGNTNDPAYKSYNSNRSLTGGMYVVFDQAGHPVGRMSANTIAEINTEDNKPEARLEQVRMPIKVQVEVNDGFGKSHMEERDSFDMRLVPSEFAQREAGMPAPKMLSDGILDPKDPNYGKGARRPAPARRPHGERVQGNRTREQYRADREKRDQAYAASEPQRAARRAELETQRKADAAAQREQDRVAAEKAYQVQREQYRRDQITRRHEQILADLTDLNPQVYDRNLNKTRPATSEEFAAHQLDRSSGDLTALARAYGLKTRGVDKRDLAPQIVAAAQAGKTPDLEVDAPKVLTGVAAAEADAKKIATQDKRRRTAITKNIEEIRNDLKTGFTTSRGGESFHLEFLSDAQLQHLAEAFGITGLTGRALKDAVLAAIKAGQTPDLDAAPITTLKKPRR